MIGITINDSRGRLIVPEAEFFQVWEYMSPEEEYVGLWPPAPSLVKWGVTDIKLRVEDKVLTTTDPCPTQAYYPNKNYVIQGQQPSMVIYDEAIHLEQVEDEALPTELQEEVREADPGLGSEDLSNVDTRDKQQENIRTVSSHPIPTIGVRYK